MEDLSQNGLISFTVFYVTFNGKESKKTVEQDCSAVFYIGAKLQNCNYKAMIMMISSKIIMNLLLGIFM